MAFNSGIQTNQILTNDDEVCIPRLSSILLAVKKPKKETNEARLRNYDQAEDSAFMQVMIYYACICK